jgi:ubiquinone/menaquinone biosynthesis C-methylase UbiE
MTADIRSHKTDTSYLLNDQYKNAKNLEARAQLHQGFSTNKTGWPRWLFDQFDFPPAARVVEFGCGPGGLWVQNQDRLRPDWDITLTDFSAGMLEEARRNLAPITYPFTFEVVDVQAIPYEDASFDAVTANHMLYHVPDLRKALSEMRRILKPGGKLYTATNGADHLREIDDLSIRFDPTIKYWEGFSASRSFELDRGISQLLEFFPNVTLRRYEDALIVTEADPLLNYMLSGPGRAAFTDEKVTALRQFLQREIDQRGPIHITKDSGVLIAEV